MILFIVAIALAWPTAGLSIVAYAGFIVMKNHFGATGQVRDGGAIHNKVAAHEKKDIRERDITPDKNVISARQSLMDGEENMPSWAKDTHLNEAFANSIQERASLQGVPAAFLQSFFQQRGSLCLAQNSSKSACRAVASDLIVFHLLGSTD